ncbi:hypothetical protein EV127DRAFT_254454 [Xylaria flabelliformis]|nr:hypothetical protein EV127DRAFT_254454 [Xylaria flabelliformis]
MGIVILASSWLGVGFVSGTILVHCAEPAIGYPVWCAQSKSFLLAHMYNMSEAAMMSEGSCEQWPTTYKNPTILVRRGIGGLLEV